MRWNIEKLIEGVLKTATATGSHPYTIVNNLVGLVDDINQSKTLRDELNSRLKAMEKELPWSF